MIVAKTIGKGVYGIIVDNQLYYTTENENEIKELVEKVKYELGLDEEEDW